MSCSCPDVLLHDPSVLPDNELFSATIKSPEIFSCPLALPSSTNSKGCPRRRRIAKHLKTKGTSGLGSTSKLGQNASTTPTIRNSFPTLLTKNSVDEVAHPPLSNSLEFDKGIAFS